jgi:hypothetical protein
MIIDDKNSVFAECEKLGEAVVRAKVDAGSFGNHSAFPRQWLIEKADERSRQREAEERQRNERALTAAEKSASSSERAAIAARDSARWTMWTAIVAIFSIVVSIVVSHFSK